MKIKSKIAGFLIMGILAGGTVGINASAKDFNNLSDSGMKKQEAIYLQSLEKVKSDISKEEALDIVANSYDKYFGIKVDIKNFNDIEFLKTNSFWTSVYLDNANNKVYFVTLEKDGKVKEIGYEGDNKSLGEIEQAIEKANSNKEEAIKIGKAFILEKGFVKNAEDISFLRVGNNAEYDFAYGKDEKTGDDKVVYMTIDASNKKVTSINFDFEKSK
ncbi:hypothetical protein [Tepidibacter aestuarii]|uniref:hypothetical protein n=1 Tax=Tepidibacter aestuarii TaxID=2925782 RepID=UPI0020C0E67D|nr:hypothetical protein [Tepidibacter aestuarii]CAH2213170.1 exported protein of unknown function [Tepidibacter aestuarii]